jgi:RNA polymerase sigma-70 factor (sigma-E family)
MQPFGADAACTPLMNGAPLPLVDLTPVTPMVEPIETFDLFVARHSNALLRCAFLIVGDRAAAHDVVQAALTKVALRWDVVVANGQPLPYVRTAVIRTAISSRRRRWHGEIAQASLPERPGQDATAVVDDRDHLRRALATLPRRQRAAVVLRHYVGLDEAAAAAVLGCSVGTVKSQTARGLARLRAATVDEAPPG